MVACVKMVIKFFAMTMFVLMFVPYSFQLSTIKPTTKPTIKPFDKEIAFNHRNLYDPYVNAYLNEYKIPTDDPKFIPVNNELYEYIAKPSPTKPLPTKRPMSPELQSCVRAITKHGIELFNALVFCLAEKEFSGKMPQDKAEASEKSGKKDGRGRREHRDDRQRTTLRPLRTPVHHVDEPEREEVNSIYDRVLLTIISPIGLW